MGRVYVITGGAKTGKSRWAVSYFEDCSYVTIITTGSLIEVETLQRIETHMKLHPGMIDNWSIVSQPLCPSLAVDTDSFYILDSISNLVSNTLHEFCDDIDNITNDEIKKVRQIIIDELVKTIEKVKNIDGNIILITTETGFSCSPSSKESWAFREILGLVNQRICGIADEVYMSVSGIQMKIK